MARVPLALLGRVAYLGLLAYIWLDALSNGWGWGQYHRRRSSPARPRVARGTHPGALQQVVLRCQASRGSFRNTGPGDCLVAIEPEPQLLIADALMPTAVDDPVRLEANRVRYAPS
jgi:hypothetical protein